MIEYQDAILQAMEGRKDLKVIDAWDMKDFYLFSIGPKDFPANETYETGTVFTAVDKKTARVYLYDIMVDPEAFLEAVKIA